MPPKWGGIAGALVALVVTATAQTVCLDECGLTTIRSSFDTYSASAAVKQNTPREAFPEKGNNTWEAYTISAAEVTILILVLCCCCCCCLCFYVCRLSKRLDHDVKSACCVPGTPPEEWATVDSRRKVAFLLLILTGLAWFIMVILAYDYNTKLSDSVREIPGILERFADFLSDEIAADLRCVIGHADAVAAEVVELQNSGSLNVGQNAIAQQVSDAVEAFKEPLNSTDGGGLLNSVTDAARELRSTASDSRRFTSTAGDEIEAFFYVCITVVLVAGLCTIGVGALVGQGHHSKKFYMCLTTLSGLMICMMWLLLLACAISFFVLRFSGGFCDDPFGVLTNYIGTDDPSNAATYYLSCADMTDAEREANWPFEDERVTTADAFTNITTLITSLSVSGADTTELSDAAQVLGCDVVSDFGFLGFRGIFSCANMQTFVQDTIIHVCTRMYDPLSSLTVVLLLLGMLVVFKIWVTQVVRREPNGGFDDPEFEMKHSSSTTQNPVMRQSNWSSKAPPDHQPPPPYQRPSETSVNSVDEAY